MIKCGVHNLGFAEKGLKHVIFAVSSRKYHAKFELSPLFTENRQIICDFCR